MSRLFASEKEQVDIFSKPDVQWALYSRTLGKVHRKVLFWVPASYKNIQRWEAANINNWNCCCRPICNRSWWVTHSLGNMWTEVSWLIYSRKFPICRKTILICMCFTSVKCSKATEIITWYIYPFTFYSHHVPWVFRDFLILSEIRESHSSFLNNPEFLWPTRTLHWSSI